MGIAALNPSYEKHAAVLALWANSLASQEMGLARRSANKR